MTDLSMWQLIGVAFISAITGGAGRHFWSSLRGDEIKRGDQFNSEACRLRHAAIDAKLGEHSTSLNSGREKFDALTKCLNELQGDIKLLLERTEKKKDGP